MEIEGISLATSSLIPEYQPIPFPAPLWLIQSLLVIGFFTHAIPMNVALGGPLIAALLLMLGFSKKDPENYFTRIGKSLANSLPIFISVAITQGIVPLLFLQLVYGPLYYSSSIFMAIPWLSIIVILLTAYYLIYIFKFQQTKLGSFGPWLLIIGTILFGVIAYFFTNNMVLMTSPEKILEVVSASNDGFNMAPADKQILPRYLHFLVSAFAITGIAIGSFSFFYSNRDEKYAIWLRQLGSGIYLVITLLQFAVGAWFLLALPREIMFKYMGQDQLATITFAVSLLLVIVSIICSAITWKTGSKCVFKLTLASSMLVVFTMIVMRHLLRIFTTHDFIKPELVPVSIQWDILIVFLIGAVALVGFLIWLVNFTWRAFSK